jgi:guanylate kinase
MKGKLIIYSGPSGVGKGFVKNLFINKPELNLHFSISATTRKPRVGEVDGEHYYFLTKQKFQE